MRATDKFSVALIFSYETLKIVPLHLSSVLLK